MKNRFIYDCGVMPFYGDPSRIFLLLSNIWVAKSLVRGRIVVEINFVKERKL